MRLNVRRYSFIDVLDSSSSRSIAMPCDANACATDRRTDSIASGRARIKKRAFGTADRIFAHVAIIAGVVFASVLSEPKVTKPFFSTGGDETSGADVGG